MKIYKVAPSVACLTGAFYEMDWLYHAMDHFIWGRTTTTHSAVTIDSAVGVGDLSSRWVRRARKLLTEKPAAAPDGLPSAHLDNHQLLMKHFHNVPEI